MIPIFISGPAVEPITLEEMKAYLRVDVDDGSQDDLIAGLIKAARLMVEAASRRILIEQHWRVVLDRWPIGGTILLPLSPLIAVDGITVTDASGNVTDVPASVFETDTLSDPPRIAFAGARQAEARHLHCAAGRLRRRAGGGAGHAEARDPHPRRPLVREPGRRDRRADPPARSRRPRGAVSADAALAFPHCHSGDDIHPVMAGLVPAIPIG
jgi:hypothetical protein